MRIGIIGYGFVGNFAALCLAQQGIDVFVFEAKDRSQLALAKAGRIDAQAYRLLEQLDIPKSKLQNLFYPLQGTQLVDKKGKVLRSFIHPQEPGMAPLYGFRQPKVQKLLQEKAKSYKNIQLFDNQEVKAIDIREDKVFVQTTKNKFLVDYLWVCDGQDSQTAQLLDLAYLEFNYARKTLYLEVENETAQKIPSHTQTFCDAKIPTTRIAHNAYLQRWAFEFPYQENIPQNALELIPKEERKGWKILSQFTLPFNVQVLENWQVFERIFFLGDAAHVLPPYLGLRLALSWKDIGNLAWKCSLVARKKANPTILWSYESERSPEALRIIRISRSIYKLFPGRFSRYLRYFLPFQQKKKLNFNSFYRKNEGIVGKNGGQLMPWFRLQTINGKSYSIDHYCQLHNFVLIALDENPIDTLWVDQLHFLAQVGCQFLELCPRKKNLEPSHRYITKVQNPDGLLERWFKQQNCHYALIRPDNIVFGTAKNEYALDKLIEELWKHLKIPKSIL